MSIESHISRVGTLFDISIPTADQGSGFTEGKPYAMEGVNGKPFVTNQYAMVAVGKAEKEWPFIACSNSKFTEVC